MSKNDFTQGFSKLPLRIYDRGYEDCSILPTTELLNIDKTSLYFIIRFNPDNIILKSISNQRE